MVKNPPAILGDLDLIPGLGRTPGGGHGNPLQCSCPENPMAVPEVAESDTTEQLSTAQQKPTLGLGA